MCFVIISETVPQSNKAPPVGSTITIARNPAKGTIIIKKNETPTQSPGNIIIFVKVASLESKLAMASSVFRFSSTVFVTGTLLVV